MSTADRRPTRAEQAARTRQRLLDAAAEAFGEAGFAATSLDAVAARAGVTKGAVYAHFTDKDHLVLTLLDELVETRLTALRAALSRGGPVPTQAGDAAAWFTGFVDGDRRWALLFFEFWLHAARDPGVRERYAAYRRGARSAVAGLLSERAAAAGAELPTPAPGLAAVALALTAGVALERLVDPDAVPEDLLAAVLARLLAP
jgi:AcrR family transcriptional regulator